MSVANVEGGIGGLDVVFAMLKINWQEHKGLDNNICKSPG
jgi:hypothetical protein